jgi:hypothetical protein
VRFVVEVTNARGKKATTEYEAIFVRSTLDVLATSLPMGVPSCG